VTPRRLAAILAADVVGFSRLMGENEAATLARLRTLRTTTIDPLMAEHHGRIFKTTGDGLLAEFSSTVDALRCALAIQTKQRETENPLPLRIGLHTGDVVIDGDDLLGDGINIAARLEPLAEPHGIALSARVREDAAGKITLDYEDLGTPTLKNISAPIRVYRVRTTTPERAPLPLPEKPSLVVLPFQNMSGDPEQEYFVDGLVEDITTAMAHISSLFVIARNSAFTYKGRAVDVRQVGRDLGVRYILEGSVRKSGTRLRITGQLIEAATGAHLWADRFEGALDDVFDLQDRITASVAGVLEPRLQRAEIERAQRKPTHDLDAYDLYLRGMAELHQAGAGHLIAAQALFTEAFQRDPTYAAAYGKAAFCVSLRITNFGLTRDTPEAAEALRQARLAVANGRDDAAALWSAGYVIGYVGRDLDAGLRLIERSCALNPNSAIAWNRVGWLNSFLGNHGTATEFFQRAIRLSPADPLLHLSQFGMAMALLHLERYDEAVTWAERAVQEQPDHTVTYQGLAITLAMAGRLEEASRALATFLRRAPEWRAPSASSPNRAMYRREEDFARFMEGLHRAGLPD